MNEYMNPSVSSIKDIYPYTDYRANNPTSRLNLESNISNLVKCVSFAPCFLISGSVGTDGKVGDNDLSIFIDGYFVTIAAETSLIPTLTDESSTDNVYIKLATEEIEVTTSDANSPSYTILKLAKEDSESELFQGIQLSYGDDSASDNDSALHKLLTKEGNSWSLSLKSLKVSVSEIIQNEVETAVSSIIGQIKVIDGKPEPESEPDEEIL